MSGSKTQVDYILVNRKWKNSVKNCEAYNTFSSTGSDHRVLTAKIKLSLRAPRAPLQVRYEWSTLKDPDVALKYSVSVQNRFQALCRDEENQSATTDYAHLVKAHEESAAEHIPQRLRKKRPKISDDPRIVTARDNVNKSFEKYALTSSDQDHETLQLEKSNLQSAYDTLQEEELNQMISKVESADATYKHGEAWRLINAITGRKSAKRGIIKGNSKAERLKKWHDYFKGLLGDPPNITDSEGVVNTIFEEHRDITTSPFTLDEYQKVKKKIITGKAAGPDGIPPEAFKYADFDDIMLKFANNLLLHQDKPEQWSLSHIQPIPKSGDLSDVGNYRGIALSPIAAKIANKMILNRIQPVLDPLLRPNQNGFRPGRSTTSHILALRRIIEGVKAHNQKAIIVFVDFKKAFDSLHRGKLMQILSSYGVPEIIVNAIEQLYKNTFTKVLSPDGLTEQFEIKAGVLQGNTLAPYLFAIAVDYIMREAVQGDEDKLGFELHPRRSSRHPAIKITDLLFADDIALLANEIWQAQELLSRVESEAAKVGLAVNAKKTEFMAFNFSEPIEIKTIGGSKLKEVLNFKYLGGWMNSTENDFNIRKALAWSACNDLRKIWTSNLNRKIKIRLFRSTVEYVLLYNSETWTISKTLSKKIDGTYTRMLRMALNISWKAKLTNVELYGSLNKITTVIRERRLRIAGHCVRHKEEMANRLVLWQPTTGQRRRGRQSVSYVDCLLEDTGADNTNEMEAMMMDRELWRGNVRLGRAGARPR